MQHKTNMSFINDDVFKRLNDMKLTIIRLKDYTLKISKAYFVQKNICFMNTKKNKKMLFINFNIPI